MKQKNQFATEEEYIEYLKQPKPFFSYDPNGEFELHATAEEAKEAAQTSLEYYQDAAADEGWDDGVTDICWGELRGEVICTKNITREEAEIDGHGYDEKNGVFWNDEWSEISYHELVDVKTGRDEMTIEPIDCLAVGLFHALLNEPPKLYLTPREAYDFVVDRYENIDKPSLDAALAKAEAEHNY